MNMQASLDGYIGMKLQIGVVCVCLVRFFVSVVSGWYFKKWRSLTPDERIVQS